MELGGGGGVRSGTTGGSKAKGNKNGQEEAEMDDGNRDMLFVSGMMGVKRHRLGTLRYGMDIWRYCGAMEGYRPFAEDAD